jgi:hypothetical protein
MKKNRGNEPIGVATINSNKQKCHFSFFFFILQNWRTGGRNRSCPEDGQYQCEGGGGREKD